MELLWENPNPSSPLNATTINIDLSGYDYFIVISKKSYHDDVYYSFLVFKNMGTFQMFCPKTSTQIFRRQITFTDSKIIISIGNQESGNDDANVIFPVAIYGNKL